MAFCGKSGRPSLFRGRLTLALRAPLRLLDCGTPIYPADAAFCFSLSCFSFFVFSRGRTRLLPALRDDAGGEHRPRP